LTGKKKSDPMTLEYFTEKLEQACAERNIDPGSDSNLKKVTKRAYAHHQRQNGNGNGKSKRRAGGAAVKLFAKQVIVITDYLKDRELLITALTVMRISKR
jgi:hypothetical protein